MIYNQVTIFTEDAGIKDMLIALLSELGYEGFEESEDGLLAFIPQDGFSESELRSVLDKYNLTFSTSIIEQTNWNKQWEESFSPVVIDGFCTIRADFHDVTVESPYEVIITPKMSFGTGHHATTQLMVSAMRSIDFRDKEVFDFGTGTGILAILASLLGAENIIAADNDEWSYQNAIENAARNGVDHISFLLGTIDDINDNEFDVILANINRHILLEHMAALFKKTKKGGLAILSGLLTEDRATVLERAVSEGFLLKSEAKLNNWILLVFSR